VRAWLLAAACLAGLSVPAQAGPRLPLHPCFAGSTKARCGTLSVPENRAEPTGRSIALKVVVLPATGKKVAPDPVVFLAGGPGGSATALADWVGNTFTAVRVHRDVLLVDQRGTGGSRPLECPPVPATVTDAPSLDAYITACQSSLGADFAQYGTAAAVDDVDAVRQALGYRKVDLYGGSYGATAAQVYLNRHPASVRSVILDSGTLLEVPIYERWASNAQRALDQIAARCAADSACAAAYPHWAGDLVPLLERLEASPVHVDVAGNAMALDGAAAADTIQNLTRTADGAANVPRVVAHAAHGDYQPFARALLQIGGASGSLAMFYSIECNEPWATWDVARSSADAEGTYLSHAYPDEARVHELVCSVFPKRTENPADWVDPRSNVPALVLVGGADPQDPIGNIAAIRQTMPRARILVAPGQGHGVGQLPCMSRLVARFLELGSATGLNTGCVHRITAPSFVIG
jgi:pimeloyl-ACP methyl ester carboxylesterase